MRLLLLQLFQRGAEQAICNYPDSFPTASFQPIVSAYVAGALTVELICVITGFSASQCIVYVKNLDTVNVISNIVIMARTDGY